MVKKIGMLILLGISMLISVFFILGAKKGDPFLGDEYLSQLISSLFSESSYPFFQVISEFGDKLGIGIVSLVMLVWLWSFKKDYSGIAVLVLAAILGNEMNKWIKTLIGRERPTGADVVETLSFPSGHAMVGLTLYLITAYLLMKHLNSKMWRGCIWIVSVALILLIGLSRIALQEHFPTDVLGGYSIGLVWTILWLFLYDWLSGKFDKSKSKHFPLNM